MNVTEIASISAVVAVILAVIAGVVSISLWYYECLLIRLLFL
jgi:hypothetical protein